MDEGSIVNVIVSGLGGLSLGVMGMYILYKVLMARLSVADEKSESYRETFKAKDLEIKHLNQIIATKDSECFEKILNIVQENNSLLQEGRKVGDKIYNSVNNNVLERIRNDIHDLRRDVRSK